MKNQQVEVSKDRTQTRDHKPTKYRLCIKISTVGRLQKTSRIAFIKVITSVKLHHDLLGRIKQ